VVPRVTHATRTQLRSRPPTSGARMQSATAMAVRRLKPFGLPPRAA
jgi:hypothetical protein